MLAISGCTEIDLTFSHASPQDPGVTVFQIGIDGEAREPEVFLTVEGEQRHQMETSDGRSAQAGAKGGVGSCLEFLILLCRF